MNALERDLRQARSDRTFGSSSRHRWTWQHYLAVLGVPFLLWEAWTLVAWLSSGPAPITKYADPTSAAWKAARVCEAAIVVASVAIFVFVVRGCRREHRLTFDAKLCIACALAFWMDTFLNFSQPVFLYSSNWTNLGNWCGNVPGVINPVCGRAPEPILFIGLTYAFGFLGTAMFACWLLRALASRWPAMSQPGQLAICALAGVVFNVIFEFPLLGLKLWSYTSFPDSLSVFVASARLPIPYSIWAPVMSFGVLGGIRYFKDDHGRTVFERGLDHLGRRTSSVVSTFALIGFLQVMILVGTQSLAIFGPYASPWHTLPEHIVNDACDAPGITGTDYGPCPGDPRYTAPIRRLPPAGAAR